MSEWHGGKGSKSRVVNKAKFDENFDRIFGHGKDNTEDSREVETGSNDPDAEVCEAETVRP